MKRYIDYTMLPGKVLKIKLNNSANYPYIAKYCKLNDLLHFKDLDGSIYISDVNQTHGTIYEIARFKHNMALGY